MGAFIPKHLRHTRPALRSYCRWCARRDARKALFKLVDGPLSYYFCNDEHAIRWCDYRHSSVAVNKLLNTPPSEREATLRGVDVDVWVAAQLNLNEL
mgnify:FL=1